jgi:hypothetical protein
MVINIKDEPTRRGAYKMTSHVSAKMLPIQMCTKEVLLVLVSFVFLSTPLSTPIIVWLLFHYTKVLESKAFNHITMEGFHDKENYVNIWMIYTNTNFY